MWQVRGNFAQCFSFNQLSKENWFKTIFPSYDYTLKGFRATIYNITVWSNWPSSSKYCDSVFTLVPKSSTTNVAKTMTNEVFMSSDVLRVPLKNENLALKRLDFYTTSLVSLWRWRKKMIAVARQRFIFTHLPAFLPKCIFHIHSFVSFITYFTKIKIVTLKIVIHKGTSWWPELRMNTNVLSYVKKLWCLCFHWMYRVFNACILYF